MGDLRYCFEQDRVVKTLKATKKKGLAVIDTDGISRAEIAAAVNRGVFVFGYLNAGALEKQRSYYGSFKSLCLAPYEGWEGEYWVDVTARAWKQHLCDTAQEIKETGAIGLYFDNPDIYYMVGKGFGGKAMRAGPSKDAVYKALAEVANTIQDDIGLTVMPNGGEDFTRKFMKQYPGRIKTINQEGVLYEDFKKQPKSERRYRTDWVDWAKAQGAYVRGIEYVKTAHGIAACKAYYALHGWPGLYISKHKDLWGD